MLNSSSEILMEIVHSYITSAEATTKACRAQELFSPRQP